MILGKAVESSNKKKTLISSSDPGNGRLLHEIEALSKALYLNRNPRPKKALLPSSSSSSSSSAALLDRPHRSISAGKSSSSSLSKPSSRIVGDKKSSSSSSSSSSSIWNWKPLKALSHIRNRRFNCRFSFQVHSIESLPSDFDNSNLVVHWRRRDGGLETRPTRVFQGIAEFEETLLHNCTVHGSGNGPHHSAKYEAKHFLVYASVVGDPDLDLGKHRIDLTRLLPLSLEELEDEKSSGKWSTSFKLSGKARGAVLNVSFGFMVLGDDLAYSGFNRKAAPENLNMKHNGARSMRSLMGYDGERLRRVESLQGANHVSHDRSQVPSRLAEDVKILHEVLPSSRPEVSISVGLDRALTSQNFNNGEFFAGNLVASKPEHDIFTQPEAKPSYDLFQSAKESCECVCDDPEFTVVEQGIEIAAKDQVKLEDLKVVDDAVEVVDITADNVDKSDRGASAAEGVKPDPLEMPCKNHGELPSDDNDSNKNSFLTKELVMEELDSAFHSLSVLNVEGLDSPQSPSEGSLQANNANCAEAKSNYKKGKMGKSLSLDDVTESVASEFLSMLGLEHSPFSLSSDSDPESPRGRLWRQFEKESLAGGGGIFGLDIYKGIEAAVGDDSPVGLDLSEFSKDYELSSMVHIAEAEHKKAAQAMKSRTRAKMLEDAETEALMREWGLNEKAFQTSPPGSASGFGSPIDLAPDETFDLPPLGEGLGPLLQTKDGGFLKSMNPSLFKNAKNNGSLIMQVSSPVVVPAEMGSGVMEILQHLASVGIEKLSMQANKLMPLEDITGKTVQQIAWEAAPALEARGRQDLLQHSKPEGLPEVGQDAVGGRKKGKGSLGHGRKSDWGSSMRDAGSEFVSLEDLAPLAMDKIEALSMEGLRIQSGMSDEEAPSNVSAQSIGEISALAGKRAKSSGSLGLEGAAGLQLLDIKDSGEDINGLMGLSITLDEWMRLDAGIVDEEEQGNSRTSNILAAHHANCTELVTGGWKGDKHGKNCGKRWGLLGNNFTVALMVQLRNPLRNYEPVGSPMLALIQVERVFVPPKPKIYSSVSDEGNSEQADEPELVIKEEKKEQEEVEVVPKFKITEVHVAGLKAEPGKKKLWGTPAQQQSGSRWLLASGMGKSNKHPFMKSKAASKESKPAPVTTTVQPGDTLWSISSRVHGTGTKWKELAALNPHIRNPNVIFPNEKIRLS